MNPRFSVIIPFFNAQETLARAVNSVLSQSFTDWELVLVNDGSKDNSESVSRTYLANPQVFYTYQKNLGVCSARNLGVTMSRFEWLVFLDADDELLVDALMEFSNSITAGGVDIVHASYFVYKDAESSLHSRVRIAGSYAISKSSFIKIEGFDPKLTYGENSELFRRAKINELRIKEASFPSVKYFENDEGGSKNLDNLIMSNLYLLEKYSDYFENHQNEKAVYLQIISVAYLREGRFKAAKSLLKECIKINFLSLGYWSRFLLSNVPSLSRLFYPVREHEE